MSLLPSFRCILLMTSLPLVQAASACAPDAEQWRNEVSAFLLQQGGVEAVDVSAFAAPPEIGARELQLRGVWPSSRMAVEVRGHECVSGKPVQQLHWFRVQAYREAWVYGRDAAAGQSLQQAAPRKARLDVAQWQLRENVEPVATDYLLRPARAGAPVRTGDLKPEPMVHRNDDVQLLVQAPGVRLRIQAKALQPGVRDEWIQVIAQGASKSTKARVVDRGIVHVEM